MSKKIIFFDTTLRDGDQAPGFHFLRNEKVKMAKQLARLGVDIIEAGFAASSEGDYQSIREISQEIGKEDTTICSLARITNGDIEIAAKSIEKANKQRIHTFIATSDIHIIHKLKKDKSWIIDQVDKGIRKAKSYTPDIEFSCEDFTRSDIDYVSEVICTAIRAGATTINMPDTVGFLTPDESYFKIKYVIDKVTQKGYNPIFSVHNHNDLGMATANTLAAINAGASQIEVTINGIGERAGNTSLEEMVAILRLKNIGFSNIKSEYIAETSRMCSELTGVHPQPNKAIVGKNAFAHEAGIHQDGMLKNRNTYEIIDPSEFGYTSTQSFGPRSGRNALRFKYSELGISFTDEEFERAYHRFKIFADERKHIQDEDLLNIVQIEK